MAEVPHIITAVQFTPVNMEPIFFRARELRALDQDPKSRKEHAGRFLGKRAVNLFYAESTRTRTSFELAEVAWGIGYSSTANARQFSSAAKGETLAHTIEIVNQYNPDLIVLRYDRVGGAAEAASLVDVPIINAGDGSGEHPTQAFLDAFTIQEQLGRLDKLQITFMGDLRFGRTVRSLAHVLSKGKNNHFDFVSTEDLRLSEDIKELLDAVPGITYTEHFHASALTSILPRTDIFYVTRTQTNLGAPKLQENKFRVTSEVANLLPSHAILLHPMPIDREDPLNSEIALEVDRHPRSRYYRQAGNGLYIRMALIEKILEGEPILAEVA
ncbi:aspartate carbamoyltransferase [Candidatus Saccharibacteria bacterium]|nr:aspartate carbamoyltransferase [Candidatus Saccharibacteria bacterium]